MNIHLELLTVDQRALRRMRALIAVSASPGDREADLELVTAEIARVEDRLAHWEAVVDRANGREQAC
ncbi:MAG TPA: hypothetical protein VIP52_01820 [Candidatus Dormibacteraeota bacterium]|jgi:hypothetical protein